MKNANFTILSLFIGLNTVIALTHHLHYYILMVDISQITISYQNAALLRARDEGEFHLININFYATICVDFWDSWKYGNMKIFVFTQCDCCHSDSIFDFANVFDPRFFV